MRIKAIVLSLATATMWAGPAFAQGDGDPLAQERGRRQLDRDVRRSLGMRPEAYRPEYDNNRWRGADPNERFRPGARIDREYRNYQYAIPDWRRHGLSRPPGGFHWVQVGTDYVLINSATGRIQYALLGN